MYRRRRSYELAKLSWAFARLDHIDEPLFAGIADVAVQRLQAAPAVAPSSPPSRFSSEEAAGSWNGRAAHDNPAEQAAPAAAPSSSSRLPSKDAVGPSNTHARAVHARPEDAGAEGSAAGTSAPATARSSAAVGGNARALKDDMQPAALSRLAWAFAHAGQYQEDLFLALADCCRECLQVRRTMVSHAVFSVVCLCAV